MAFGSLPSVLGSGGGTAYSLIGGTGLFADGTAAAPSISFASQTNKGFYHRVSNQIGLSLAGSESLIFTTGGGLQGTNSNGAIFNSSGGVSIFAGGTAQNITLTPGTTGTADIFNDSSSLVQLRLGAGTVSYWGLGRDNSSSGALLIREGTSEKARFLTSTGRFLLGTTTDSGALLQIGTNTTTSAGGMVFGTDTFLYRSAAGTLTIQSATNTILQFAEGASASVRIQQSSGACYIDTQSAQPIVLRTNNTTALTLDASQNAAFAGTVKPQLATTAGAPAYVKGAIYFDTTLNKLRVGGAAAWETITSV